MEGKVQLKRKRHAFNSDIAERATKIQSCSSNCSLEIPDGSTKNIEKLSTVNNNINQHSSINGECTNISVNINCSLSNNFNTAVQNEISSSSASRQIHKSTKKAADVSKGENKGINSCRFTKKIFVPKCAKWQHEEKW